MKKIDIAQTISILANLGVLAGIVFLAIEIRQNTRSQEINAYQDVVAQIAAIGAYWVQEPEHTQEIFRLLELTPAELSSFDSTRAAAFAMLLLRHGDLVFFQYQRDVITEERMRSGLTILNNITCTPFVQDFWPTARNALDPEYGEYMDQRIQDCEL